MKMDVTTRIGGINLENPIFNASGPRCTTPEHLNALGESQAAAILSKSCTLQPRDGNPKPRYQEFPGGSINSMGLPNLGYEEYAKLYPTLSKYNKPIMSSVSGLSLDDNLKIIEVMNDVDALDAIELNLSCPNLVGKPQVGYDFDQSRDVLEAVGKLCKKPLGVKLPPYFDFVHFQSMAEILNDSKVKFATCVNSLGNGLVIDPQTETVVIKPKGGFGGVGGPVIKPFGLSNVRKFRELLKPEINVIGVGGIEKGMDVFEYILAGADAVQIGTVLQNDGPGAFARILAQFKLVMEKKGYESLDDFKNKLKVIE